MIRRAINMKVGLIMLLVLLSGTSEAAKTRHLTQEEMWRERLRMVGGNVEVPPLPTNEELSQIFQGVNYTTRSNVMNVVVLKSRFGKLYPQRELRRVGYQILTNVVIRMNNEFDCCDYQIIGDCLRFPGMESDVDIMNLCVDLLGKYCMLPIPTNDLNRFKVSWNGPLKPIDGRPGVLGYKQKPFPAYDHNFKIQGAHRCLFGIVKDRVRNFEKKLPESERPAFRTNVIERARLLPEEASCLFEE